ncbi:DNA repair protein RecO [Desulfotomaculum defluvii]
MKTYKIDAIVLKARDMREADKILTVYSIQKGKQRIVAHGAAKPNSRKRGAVQPFCFSEFMLHRGRELDSISQAELREGFSELRLDLDRITAAAYVAELIDGFTAEEEPNQSIFRLFYSTLHLIAAGGQTGMILRAFEAKLLGYSGLQPELNHCSLCDVEIQDTKVSFGPQQGGLLCKGCAGLEKQIMKFSRGTIEILKTIYRWELTKLHQLKVPEALKRELHMLLRTYIEYHLEKRLKTTEFMDRLYKTIPGRGTNM